MPPTIAWIGLGTMGAPMARNLLQSGFSLVVHNRTLSRARPLADLGARLAATPREAASLAEIVVVMVSDPDALAAVLEGEDGAAAGLRAGALLVDMGTNGAPSAHRAAVLAGARSASFIDAPVLGSRKPAEDGTLVVMAGGQAEDVARARPVFAPLSRSIHHVGPVGAGQTMKLAANLMLGHMLTGLAGSVAFAHAAGLAPADLVTILHEGLGSPYFRIKGDQMVTGDFERPQFTLDLARKDVALIREALEQLGISLPTAGPIASIFDEAARRGEGQNDGAAIVKLWWPETPR